MPYTIAPDADGKYIVITVTGNTNRQMALEYHLAAHSMGKKLGINCYLVDLTESRNTDTVLRNYTFANNDMKHPGIDPEAHIAMLVSAYDHTHDFLEPLLKNVGIDVNLFYDREVAVQYLLEV